MGYDRKYGKVTTEFGNIGDDEPVVVFRARDKLLPKVLAYYHLFCIKEGSPKRHLNIIMNTLELVKNWQALNQTKTPDSETSKQWMSGE
jgi:hypothetical protein